MNKELIINKILVSLAGSAMILAALVITLLIWHLYPKIRSAYLERRKKK